MKSRAIKIPKDVTALIRRMRSGGDLAENLRESIQDMQVANQYTDDRVLESNKKVRRAYVRLLHHLENFDDFLLPKSLE